MHNYAVSDIHGNAERLSALLSVLKKKHPNKDFTLHIVGDLFDRGVESREVIELITNNFENINVLKGNHEDLFMQFMEDPVECYAGWQMNGAYPTIMSFLMNNANSLVDYCQSKSMLSLKSAYQKKYNEVASTLSLFDVFGSQNNSPEDYISQIEHTTSDRDHRSVARDIRSFIKSVSKDKPREYIFYVERLAYLYTLQDFCDIYNYFDSLKTFDVVDDKFLLVHSGYVSQNYDPCVHDNINPKIYEPCHSIEDLQEQNPYPMLWSRRKNIDSGLAVAPQKRFDGKIVIFGHTTTNRFSEDGSFDPVFTYDFAGRLASIGLDGLNCHKEYGNLNCVCLDDLSQIIIKGSNHFPRAKHLSIEHRSAPHNQPQPE